GAALAQVRDVDLQRGGVHGHQDVHLVTGRVNVITAKVKLITRDAINGAGRGANLGGKVRHGAHVVAKDGRRVGELHTAQLHAVAGIAGKTDGGAGQVLDRLAACGGALDRHGDEVF